ncbi:type-2 ice-structuring protein-like [Macrobrachium nipponense]|uniref:type-2 ice-structuring protein-like n=1 Tax=Macrobrachium nipponense TaxID=159736 RepID=UPI0030C881CA
MACNGRGGGVSPTRGLGRSLLPSTLTWIIAVVLVTLLLPQDALAKRPVVFKVGWILPQQLIALEEKGASSCHCRIKCMINMSCTALSILVNKDSEATNCLFSNKIIPLDALSMADSAYTWVHNDSEATTTSTSLGTTTPVTTTQTTTTDTTAGPIVCRSSWIVNGASCYLFSNVTANWDTAKQNCIDMKSNLTVITSDDEYNFLLEKVVVRAWIGMYSPYFNKTFLWIDGTTPTIDKWGTDEPNNAGYGEYCAEIYKPIKGWNDASCTITIR